MVLPIIIAAIAASTAAAIGAVMTLATGLAAALGGPVILALGAVVAIGGTLFAAITALFVGGAAILGTMAFGGVVSFIATSVIPGGATLIGGYHLAVAVAQGAPNAAAVIGRLMASGASAIATLRVLVAERLSSIASHIVVLIPVAAHLVASGVRYILTMSVRGALHLVRAAMWIARLLGVVFGTGPAEEERDDAHENDTKTVLTDSPPTTQ
ncbi:hypothetical protein CYLTODRAFT_420736 [Cylindrobasidium torrendii FP15055 ss-10]|uniref:Uncharacterized protein n=1 Tax=Cylindrobasidium torrendii FP15055 ss-10 TaxID=1314674 RepID=A0A0D7BH57_9AGAR|nr:hypothetical protein CYLTODRAFT_420736 [Cylindrobasidium torrendii FP15055 ss-10]